METVKNINSLSTDRRREMIRIGISTDFGWFELKLKLIATLKAVGYELADLGSYELVTGDNYPDFVVPILTADSEKRETQNQTKHKIGILACETANRIPGVRAAVITETSGTCDEVEKEDLYIRCLGGQVKGYSISKKKVMTFLNAGHSASLPSNQRLAKVTKLVTDHNILERERHLA